MSFAKLRNSRLAYVCWQFIACFAPFLWAARQAYFWSDQRICVAAEVPLRTEVGAETIADFRTLEQRTVYGIHIVSDRADGTPFPVYPKTALPLVYDVRVGGVAVPVREGSVWAGFGNNPKRSMTVYSSVKFFAGQDVNSAALNGAVRVRPVKPLTQYGLIRPRLRIYSFDRFYQYAMPRMIGYQALSVLLLFLGGGLFLRRLKKGKREYVQP